VLLIISTAKASTDEIEKEDAKVSYSFKTGVFNKYVSPLSGVVYSDGHVAQTEIGISFPWFDLGIWNNYSLHRGTVEVTGDEIDYTISRSDSIGKVDIEYGVSYYDFNELFHGQKDNAVAYFLELSTSALYDKLLEGNIFGNKITAENYVRIERDVATSGSDFEGGTYFSLGARGILTRSVLNDCRAMVDISINHDGGVYGWDPRWVYTGKWLFEEDINKDWTFCTDLMFVYPNNYHVQTVLGLSLKTEF